MFTLNLILQPNHEIGSKSFKTLIAGYLFRQSHRKAECYHQLLRTMSVLIGVRKKEEKVQPLNHSSVPKKGAVNMASEGATPKTLFLDSETVKRHLKWDELIPAVERALKNYSKGPKGGVIQPDRSVIEVPKHNGFLLTMPSYSASEDALATKMVSIFEDNKTKGLPSHNAIVVLFGANTGIPKAVMDGEVITAMRTAAASAVATKHLACEKPEILALLGAGVQAKSHFEALTHMFRFSEIRVWSRTFSKADTLVKYISSCGFNAWVSNTAKEAVTDADVIVTATLAKEPILQDGWLKKGAHVNGIGACRPNWQEVDPELVRKMEVYVDSRSAAPTEAGDIIISKAPIYAEIGEVVGGTTKGNREKTTFCKLLGMAVEDAVAANLVYENYSKSSN